MEKYGLKGIYSKDNEYIPMINENKNNTNMTNHILTFIYINIINIIKNIRNNKLNIGVKISVMFNSGNLLSPIL